MQLDQSAYEIQNGIAVPCTQIQQALDNSKTNYLKNEDPVVPKTVWTPFPNTSQSHFIECNSRYILYGGTRGPGKTDAALMKFAKYCGRGYGAAWRGIVFSTRYKNLDDVVTKGKKWFFQQNIGVKFLASKDAYKFVWPTGEELLLRILDKDDDYWNYHGHEYPFVLFEELTKWKTQHLYDACKSINRSSHPNIPKFYIATTNPYGAGHHWVKELWIDPNPALCPEGSLLPPDGEGMDYRVRFDGDIMENEFLKANDPEYILSIENITNDALRAAWRYGDWNINVGAFFHGYLSRDTNMCKPFMPPSTWPRWKAYDWGSARPFSIGYYALNPEGVIFRYRELYGWDGSPNVGSGMIISDQCDWMDEVEAMEIKNGMKFTNNPADDSMWSNNGMERTQAQEFAIKGHIWQKAKKNLWGRIRRWQLLKEMFQKNTFMITSDCTNFWRTMPNLMCDDNNWEDIDTDSEDHIADEVGYSVTSRHMNKVLKKGQFPKNKPDTSQLGNNMQYAHLLPINNIGAPDDE